MDAYYYNASSNVLSSPVPSSSQQSSSNATSPGQQQTTTTMLKKEALMHMIAQEMVSTLMGEKEDKELEDEAVLEELQKKLLERQKSRRAARKKLKRKESVRKLRELKESPAALADVYYSHMGSAGGERLAVTAAATAAAAGDVGVIKDDDSFAGGHLDALVDQSFRRSSSEVRAASKDGSFTSRNDNDNNNNGSKESSFTSRNSGSRSGGRRNRSSSKGRPTTITTTTKASQGSTSATGSSSGSRSAAESSASKGVGDGGEGGSNTQKELSVDEIRQYVVQHIPQAVREQIPEEAWTQIFGGQQLQGKATKNKSSAAVAQAGTKIKIDNDDDVPPIGDIVIGGGGRGGDGDDGVDDANADDYEYDDNISVYSEVSGLTSAFPDGKRVEHRRASLNHKLSLDTVEQGKEDGSKDTPRDVDDDDEKEEKRPESAKFSTTSGRNSLMDNSDWNPTIASSSRIISMSGSMIDTDRRRKVKFNEVQVRYYERIVTDNPAVQSGPAIGIGWRYKRAGSVSLNYWEQSKPSKKTTAELVLPRHVREHMLREAGCSRKDVAEMVRISLKIRNQRKQTVNNLPAAGFEEAIEKATRRVTKLLSFGRKSAILKN